MNEMYFSRAWLNLAGLSAAEARQWGSDPYHRHRWVWRLFEEDPDVGRDFLFRVEDGGSTLGNPHRVGMAVYLVSRRKPVSQGPWRVEVKPFAPHLRAGEWLTFKVRVNPVIKHRVRDAGEVGTKGGKAKHQRWDVVQAARKKAIASGEAVPPRGELVQEAGCGWLLKRAETLGFSLRPENLMASAYQHYRFQQSNRRGDRNWIGLSTLDLSGMLKVTDPELLTRALFQGVGPAKSFGCGLFMVRRTE